MNQKSTEAEFNKLWREISHKFDSEIHRYAVEQAFYRGAQVGVNMAQRINKRVAKEIFGKGVHNG